jgi:hypothetical protein
MTNGVFAGPFVHRSRQFLATAPPMARQNKPIVICDLFSPRFSSRIMEKTMAFRREGAGFLF